MDIFRLSDSGNICLFQASAALSPLKGGPKPAQVFFAGQNATKARSYRFRSRLNCIPLFSRYLPPSAVCAALRHLIDQVGCFLACRGSAEQLRPMEGLLVGRQGRTGAAGASRAPAARGQESQPLRGGWHRRGGVVVMVMAAVLGMAVVVHMLFWL